MVKIRGAGRQIAELTILRGLHSVDAFFADDVGVRRFTSQFYRNGEKISLYKSREFAPTMGGIKKGLLRIILK